jgi:hypothetical protein
MNNDCSNICPGVVRFEVLIVVTMNTAASLECDVVYSGRNLLTFGKTSSFHHKGRIIKMEAFLLEIFNFLPANMASHPRRQVFFLVAALPSLCFHYCIIITVTTFCVAINLLLSPRSVLPLIYHCHHVLCCH